MQQQEFRGAAIARAHSGQVRQAQRVNSTRAADYKGFLQVFDVCTIAMNGNTRGATDKRCIAVLITQVVPYTSPTTKATTYRYTWLTKVGYLARNQDWSDLDYKPNLTGTLMGIDAASADGSKR